MTLGTRIRQARESRGWDLPRLAKESGIPYPTLAGIEQGNQRTSTKVPQLALTLGVSAVWLATGKPDGEMNVKQRPPAMGDSSQIHGLDAVMMGQALFWLDFEEFELVKQGLPLPQPVRRGERLIALYKMIVANGGILPQEEADRAIANRQGAPGHDRGTGEVSGGK